MLYWTISHSRRVASLKNVWAKLLYTWLIPSTDNLGRMEGDPAVIAGMIFPREPYATPARIESWLSELHDAGLICWYEGRGDRFIYLKQHERHQTIKGNMSETSDFPAPPAECAVCTEAFEHVHTRNPKEKRREEKRREVNTSGSELRSTARRLLDFLNEKASRNYQAVDTNVDLIVARLKELSATGASADDAESDCRAIVALKCRAWTGDEKMATYLRPATLFNKSKFWQYHGELNRG